MLGLHIKICHTEEKIVNYGGCLLISLIKKYLFYRRRIPTNPDSPMSDQNCDTVTHIATTQGYIPSSRYTISNYQFEKIKIILNIFLPLQIL